MDNFAFVSQYVAAILLGIVVPFSVPFAYARSSLLTFSWGYHEPEVNRNLDFVDITRHANWALDNAIINVTALQLGIEENLTHVHGALYLDHQEFATMLKNESMDLVVGVATVLLLIIVVVLRRTLKNNHWMKIFVHCVLHAQFWNGDSRLKFTHVELLNGCVKLFEIVPTVWFCIVLSIGFFVPCGIWYCSTFFHAIKGIPYAFAAAWLAGKLYLEVAILILFRCHVQHEARLVTVRREFEKGLNDVFYNLGATDRSVSITCVTVEEMETLASFKTLEMWSLLKICRMSGIDHLKKFAVGVNSTIMKGRWGAVNEYLEQHASGLLNENWSNESRAPLAKEGEIDSSSRRADTEKHDSDFVAARKNFLNSCLLDTVVVTDTKMDTAYKIYLESGRIEPVQMTSQDASMQDIDL